MEKENKVGRKDRDARKDQQKHAHHSFQPSGLAQGMAQGIVGKQSFPPLYPGSSHSTDVPTGDQSVRTSQTPLL